MPVEREVGYKEEPIYPYECPLDRCVFEGCAGTVQWAWYRLGPHLEEHVRGKGPVLYCLDCETPHFEGEDCDCPLPRIDVPDTGGWTA